MCHCHKRPLHPCQTCRFPRILSSPLLPLDFEITLQSHEACALSPHSILSSATCKRKIAHHSVCFVDDNDGQVLAKHKSANPIVETVGKLQNSSQKWSNLINLTGHSLALHKINWRMVAW